MVGMSRGNRGAGTRWLVAACAAAVAVATVVALPDRAVAANATPDSGVGQPAPFIGSGNAPRSGHGTSNSLDWAGFAATPTGSLVTSVTGSWTEPSVVCPVNKVQQSAFWVGIDGFAATDPTVQQVGTDADCLKGSKKVAGGPVYYAWYQMYPSSLVVLNPASYPVAPGDVLTGGVSVVLGGYLLTLSDSRGGLLWSFSQVVAATTATLNASAEWIAEAPTACKAGTCKALPLADFSSVAFTGATVNSVPVNGPGFVDSQITMTKDKKGKKVKASPSALGGTGGDFTVTWLTN